MSQKLSNCNICPRKCNIDRKEESGFCKVPPGITVSSSLIHYGEEPVFSGETGVGNFFFTSCNLSCVYCQNFQISQTKNGKSISEQEFIDKMFEFENSKCSFIGLVSPGHQSPWIRSAVKKAKAKGLKTGIIYNSSAYDDVSQLKLWEGLIDVYLPDIKYADDKIANRYSSAIEYVKSSRKALLEMYRQVGPVHFDSSGEKVLSGLWVRHLVLPNNLAGSWETLCFLALEISTEIGLSLMSQYKPLYRAKKYKKLSRCITKKEYNDVIEMAESLGFKNVLHQDLETSPHCFVPDFDNENPFVDAKMI